MPASPPRCGGDSPRRRRRGASSVTTSRKSTPPGACAELHARRLLDRQLARLRFRALRERELEHAVLVLRVARRLVDLDREHEAAMHRARMTLAAQDALAVL